MPVVEVTAGPIHYVEDGQGPPVVLLHGLFMDHTVWDRVLPLLPSGFRYLRPVLPLGSHRDPMRPDADLSLRGLAGIVADFLATLDLREVTLVHSDWGGGLLMTAYGLDCRLARLVVFPCEAFDNFPPGVPGKLAVLAARIPGGLAIAVRQLRIGAIRRIPFVFGHMARRPIPDALMNGWTEAALHNRQIRRDVRKYGLSLPPREQLIADTEALRKFSGPALVLWSSAGKVMPRDHGRRLAELLPEGKLVEIDDAYVLSMLDRPEAVAAEVTRFLSET